MQNAKCKMQNEAIRIRIPGLSFCILHFALCISLTGCQIFGIIAQAAPKIVAARYGGLKGKTVAVMVWAEPMVTNDWPIEEDLSAKIIANLKKAQTDDHPAELEGTTFPLSAEAIARFQVDHPGSGNQPIAEVAKQLGVDRLIYIEIDTLETRPENAVTSDLFLGKLIADMRVVEADGNPPVTAYTESKISARFPEKNNDAGVLNLGDEKAYYRTLELFADTAAKRFYKHEEERKPGE